MLFVPFSIVLMLLVYTLGQIRCVLTLAIQTFEFMFALTGVFAGFLQRAATRGKLIVINSLVGLSTPSALLVIKSAPTSPVGPGPAFLALREEFPLLSIFDFNKLTSYVVNLIDDFLCADTLLRVPHI